VLSTVTLMWFSAAGGHSAGCRKSWFCLQHHATIVTSNGVTICGSKFPPTVSKHCQHQHSAIHKTIPTIWNTNNPSCCDIQGAASSVQHHGSLFIATADSSLMSLQTCQGTKIHNVTIYSSIQYGHLLLTCSAFYPKCPTVNIQQYNLISQSLPARWW